MPAVKRHPFDPEAIAQAVTQRLAEIEAWHQRAQAEHAQLAQAYAQCQAQGTAWAFRTVPGPERAAQIQASYAAQRERETAHYARVRVIERPADAPVSEHTFAGDGRFFLVYGDDADAGPAGTGGFNTAEAARAWFTQSGR